MNDLVKQTEKLKISSDGEESYYISQLIQLDDIIIGEKTFKNPYTGRTNKSTKANVIKLGKRLVRENILEPFINEKGNVVKNTIENKVCMQLNEEKQISIGGITARGGFKLEKFLSTYINSYPIGKNKIFKNVNKYLFLSDISSCKILSRKKSDLVITDKISTTYVQVKRVSNYKSSFNQIDKRWVDKYAKLLNIPVDIIKILKKYTGELKITQNKKSLPLTEHSKFDINKLILFFETNKEKILKLVILGNDPKYHPKYYIICIQPKMKNIEKSYIISTIDILSFYMKQKVFVTKKGVLRIGSMTIQRKGGDNGAKTAQMLQFKIKPLDLIYLEQLMINKLTSNTIE